MFCKQFYGKYQLTLYPSVRLCAFILIALALTANAVYAKDLHISNNHLRVIYDDEKETLKITSIETAQTSFSNSSRRTRNPITDIPK